jgi:hypothetical protein
MKRGDGTPFYEIEDALLKLRIRVAQPEFRRGLFMKSFFANNEIQRVALI